MTTDYATVTTTDGSGKPVEYTISVQGNSEEKKRTPQIYRQCWAILKAEVGFGGYLRTRRGLLKLMEDIEREVKG